MAAALDEHIQRQKQLEILDLFDTIEYRRDYNYKANRLRDRIACER